MEHVLRLGIFLRLTGIGAASGLCLDGDRLLLIADDSTFLYEYSLSGSELRQIPLVTHAARNISKADKPDFEAMVLNEGAIEIFGSGSRPNRMDKITISPLGKVTTEDLSATYGHLREMAGIAPDEFNIEGVVYHGGATFYFQRGNGAAAENGVFRSADGSVEYHRIALPSLDGVAATFTDATLVGDVIYFLAAAEASASTYHDGAVSGSLIGTIDPVNLQHQIVGRLPGRHKFEGLAFFKRDADGLHFLLCEDSDAQQERTVIWQLTLSDR